MSKNPLSLSEIQNPNAKSNENHEPNLFEFINRIKADDIEKVFNVYYSQVQCLSGFKSSSFSNSELYFDFNKKVNQIESINITDNSSDSSDLLRIMILISFLYISNEGRNANDFNLTLKKINNEEIKQEEIELANKIRNIDKSIDLINEGWLIKSINYKKNDANNIESLYLTKGTEKVCIPSKVSNTQSLTHSTKSLAPSSPHSNQHSKNRRKKQSTRQFDRTDYSNESSNYNEDYDYYTDDDDELLKDTFLQDQNESRLSLRRRTNSEPFIEIDPMFIFDDNKNKNNNDKSQETEELDFQDEIDELDIVELKSPVQKKNKNNNNNSKENLDTINNFSNNNWKSQTKQNNKINNEVEKKNCSYSYGSNSSDFDYNYYSSGEEEMTTTSNSYSSKENKQNNRNYSNERRRHRCHHHHISKQIKNKIELRKLEESPRRASQLYIDEFDDVRKLSSSHNKQEIMSDAQSHNCKNNNKRDFDFEFNDSDDSDENEIQFPSTLPHQGSIKPSFSSPSNVSLSLPYELIDFKDNKSNFNELEDDDDNQPIMHVNLSTKLNFDSKTIQKKKKIQTLFNYSNENDDDDEEEEEEINQNININICSGNNNSNDFIYDNDDDNENSSSDSNEDFDDLVYVQKSKNNNKSNNEIFAFEQNEQNEASLPMINDDIYCSEPFPVSNSDPNDNALLSPNHRKLSRSSKKRSSNNS